MFKLGNWHFANNYFKDCQKLLVSDKIANIYLKRCRNYLHKPPINWTGAITLDFK